MKDYIFHLISTIIRRKVLTLCHTVGVKHCDLLKSLCRTLMLRRNKLKYIKYTKSYAVVQVNEYVKHSYFIVGVCELTVLLLLNWPHRVLR